MVKGLGQQATISLTRRIAMNRREAINWVWNLCILLRQSQTRTLAELVSAACHLGRSSLAEIGRRVPDTSAKHGIKRCWRFTANSRVVVSDAMTGLHPLDVQVETVEQKGMCRVLQCSEYRRHQPVEQGVVVRWKKGLPKRRDECWFLMSDLPQSAQRLSELYAARMTIEEFFRDGKNRRNGFALRNTQIQHADRFDRYLLILVLAYFLLIGVGLVARQKFSPSSWCGCNRPRECSDFTIGQRMLEKLEVPWQQTINAIIMSLFEAIPNWG
jgi:hypothetical protein